MKYVLASLLLLLSFGVAAEPTKVTKNKCLTVSPYNTSPSGTSWSVVNKCNEAIRAVVCFTVGPANMPTNTIAGKATCTIIVVDSHTTQHGYLTYRVPGDSKSWLYKTVGSCAAAYENCDKLATDLKTLYETGK